MSRPCSFLLSDTNTSFLPWEMVPLYLATSPQKTLICDPPASTSQRFQACTPISRRSGSETQGFLFARQALHQ